MKKGLTAERDSQKFNIKISGKIMKKIAYSKLKFPRGLNLNLLQNVLPEKKFREFIVKYSRKDRKSRRIMLPSSKTIKKVYSHYIWGKIKAGETTWEKVKKDFQRNFGSLRSINISKENVKRLYLQREKEIEKERKNIEKNL